MPVGAILALGLMTLMGSACIGLGGHVCGREESLAHLGGHVTPTVREVCPGHLTPVETEVEAGHLTPTEPELGLGHVTMAEPEVGRIT